MEQGNVPIAAPAIDIIDPSRAMAVITPPERVISSFNLILDFLSKLILDYFKQHNADKNSDLRPTHSEYHISDLSVRNGCRLGRKKGIIGYSTILTFNDPGVEGV